MGGHITRGLAIGLTGLAVLITTTACNRNQNAKAAAPPPPTEVIVAPVEQRTVSIVRDFTARTEAVPTVEVRARGAVPERATPDPDDFSCGFAVWNGSSFSAPAFAGELARLLSELDPGKDTRGRCATAVKAIASLLDAGGQS